MKEPAWPAHAPMSEPPEHAAADAPHAQPAPPRSALALENAPQEAIVDGLAFEPFLHFQFQCAPPFRLEIASNSRAPLYIVGTACRLQWEDDAPVALNAGDVVFLPHAGRHRVYTDERAPLQGFHDLIRHSVSRRGKSFEVLAGPAPQQGDRAAANRWGGSFYWRSELDGHPLLASLPPVVVLARADAAAWLPTMTQLVAWMADIRGGGNGVGLTQVMNSLLQRVVLAWLSHPARAAQAPHGGDAGAARDDRLLPALQGIHTQCAHPWTAHSLAALCHMSRTQFTQRFQAQTGLPPMRYLTRWRLHLADRMLKEQRLTLQQVADAVGYSTGAILARAYKRERGTAPRFKAPTEQTAEKSR